MAQATGLILSSSSRLQVTYLLSSLSSSNAHHCSLASCSLVSVIAPDFSDIQTLFFPVPRFRCYCSSDDTCPPSVKKRVVSGVQPTGSIHLGNYLGANKNWVNLQDTYETLFFIVDLHAITLPYDVQELRKATRDTAALYLACGVDISKALVFVQSHFRAHVELMWLLSSTTPIGWLQKMTQFKEISRKEVPFFCEIISLRDTSSVIDIIYRHIVSIRHFMIAN